MNERVEVLIGQITGETDPPNISVTFKQGASTVIRVEMTPEDFALAVTGRLTFGIVTRGSGVVGGPAK
jgi:hypothetical protein